MRGVSDHDVEDWVDAAARAADREDQSEWVESFGWRVPEEITDREAQVDWLWENARDILETELEEAIAEARAVNREDQWR